MRLGVFDQGQWTHALLDARQQVVGNQVGAGEQELAGGGCAVFYGSRQIVGGTVQQVAIMPADLVCQIARRVIGPCRGTPAIRAVAAGADGRYTLGG